MAVELSEFERDRLERIALLKSKVDEFGIPEAVRALEAHRAVVKERKCNASSVPSVPLQATTRSQSQQHPRFLTYEDPASSSLDSPSCRPRQRSGSLFSPSECSDEQMSEEESPLLDGGTDSAGQDGAAAAAAASPRTSSISLYLASAGILVTPHKVAKLAEAGLTPNALKEAEHLQVPVLKGFMTLGDAVKLDAYRTRQRDAQATPVFAPVAGGGPAPAAAAAGGGPAPVAIAAGKPGAAERTSVNKAMAAVGSIIPAWVGVEMMHQEFWVDFEKRKRVEINAKADALFATYGATLGQKRTYFYNRIQRYVRDQRRGVDPLMKGGGFHSSRSASSDSQQLLLLNAAVTTGTAAVAAADQQLLAAFLAAFKSSEDVDQASEKGAQEDKLQELQQKKIQALASKRQAEQAKEAATAALTAAQQALDAHKVAAQEALAAHTAGQGSSEVADTAAAAETLAGMAAGAGSKRRAAAPAHAAKAAKAAKAAATATPGGSSRPGNRAAAAASAPSPAAAAAAAGAGEESEDVELTNAAEQAYVNVVGLHLRAKYYSVAGYADAGSHAEHLARTLPEGGVGNSSKVTMSTKQYVLLMGCSSSVGMPEVLAVATPITSVVVRGGTVPATASFSIKAVKPGLGSVSGLVHVHGETVSRKLNNLTSCGKSVDGWPLTGVLLQEPRCEGLHGGPNDVINRWAIEAKELRRR